MEFYLPIFLHIVSLIMVSKPLLRILFQESLCVREGGSIIELLEKSKGEWSLPRGLSGQECTCNAGKADSIPGSGRSWRRKWKPTAVFLPGKSHGQRSLAGYSPWGHKKVGHNLAIKR